MKRTYYKTWQKSRKEKDFKRYKYVRKEAKKGIRDVKFKTYDDLYDKLGTKDGENDVYKLAKLRERKTRDFNHIKCIKNEDSRVLVQEEKIKEMWRSYFEKLLNENHTGNTILEERGNTREI